MSDNTHAPQIQMHWQVVNRTYPGTHLSGPQTDTEFEFGNGVTIHYFPEDGELYFYLPVREALLSVGHSVETVSVGQVRVDLDRTADQLTGIKIVRAESPSGDAS